MKKKSVIVLLLSLIFVIIGLIFIFIPNTKENEKKSYKVKNEIQYSISDATTDIGNVTIEENVVKYSNLEYNSIQGGNLFNFKIKNETKDTLNYNIECISDSDLVSVVTNKNIYTLMGGEIATVIVGASITDENNTIDTINARCIVSVQE